MPELTQEQLKTIIDEAIKQASVAVTMAIVPEVIKAITPLIAEQVKASSYQRQGLLNFLKSMERGLSAQEKTVALEMIVREVPEIKVIGFIQDHAFNSVPTVGGVQ